MAHTSQRQHLRAIFGGRHMTHLLALGTHRGLLGADIAIGGKIDLGDRALHRID